MASRNRPFSSAIAVALLAVLALASPAAVAQQPVAVSTVAVRVADLERPERIAELLRAVKAPEGGERAFFFLILSSADMTRYYPFRIALPR